MVRLLSLEVYKHPVMIVHQTRSGLGVSRRRPCGTFEDIHRFLSAWELSPGAVTSLVHEGAAGVVEGALG